MSGMVRVGEFRVDKPIREAVERVLKSERISEGKETRAFEESFASFIGTKHAVAVNSGTSALIAGLTAIKINSGDKNIQNKPKVVTAPLTYVATANAIVLAGMEPVFVDVDPDTFTITPENVKAVLEKDRSEKIGGVLPVHLMGYVCDMDPLRSMAREHEAFLFEDSSQAHGSLYKGRRAGSMSDMSSFSFYIAHNIQAGELGAVLTNDMKLARLVRKIKANGRVCDCLVCTRDKGKCPRFREGSKGWDPRFFHDIIGYNFKTMEFPAAIANAQISRADDIAAKRRRNVKTLNDLLSKHEDEFRLPQYSDGLSYLGYPIVIRDPKKINRERFQVALERNGVETRPLFGCIPIHQPSFAHLKKKYQGKLPNAEYIGANGFYIGCHQYLSEKDLRAVSSAFDRSIGEAAR
jgi:CDP-6-deoxy-D-xylo-4-hexulose-3-dehydrase